MLREQCDLQLGEAELEVGEARFPCAVVAGGDAPPEEAAPGALPGDTELPVIGRRAIAPGVAPPDLTPDSRAPSSLHGEPGATPGLTVETYGPPLTADLGLNGVALGAFLHRCFEVLGPRPELAARLPTITGVAADAEAMAQVTQAVARFEAWLTKCFARQAVLREWPVLAIDAKGSVVSGTADLVVHTAEGLWIIDHKSDQVEDPAQAFAIYAPQLAAYAAALEVEGQRVLGVGVNCVRRGVVMIARCGDREQKVVVDTLKHDPHRQ